MPFGYNTIYVINADGSDHRRLTRHAYTESGFAWSPDSRRIGYARERRGGVYLINVDGSGDRRLTRNPMRQDLLAGGFAWSPDGRRIVYSSDRTGHGDIYLMNADGSEQRRLTQDPITEIAPVWSPALEKKG
jgi:Tol biopolymer transport system component